MVHPAVVPVMSGDPRRRPAGLCSIPRYQARTPGVNILSTAHANALDEFMKIGHPVDKLELFGDFFFIFLEKNRKIMKNTGFS